MKDTVLFAGVHKSMLGVCFGMIEQNDPGHRLPHIRDVTRNGLQIAEHYGIDPIPFKLAAVCHDIYSSVDRPNHHLLAGQWVRDNFKHYPGFDKYTELVARMCEEHRSSYRGRYSGLFEEGFSAADRGVPKVEDSVIRSFNYHNVKGSGTLISIVNDSIAHLQVKFGPNGYNRDNVTHREVFGDSLERFKTTVMKLTADQYIWILKKHNLV